MEIEMEWDRSRDESNAGRQTLLGRSVSLLPYKVRGRREEEASNERAKDSD